MIARIRKPGYRWNKKGSKMTIRIVKNITLFAVGILVGMWFMYIDREEPTPQECLSVCVEQFEQFGC